MNHRFLKNTEFFVLIAIALFALSGCSPSGQPVGTAVTPSEIVETTEIRASDEYVSEEETSPTEETESENENLYKSEEDITEGTIETEESNAALVGALYRYFIEYPEFDRFEVTDSIHIEDREDGFYYYVPVDTALIPFGTEDLEESEIDELFGAVIEEYDVRSKKFSGKKAENGNAFIRTDDGSIYFIRRVNGKEGYNATRIEENVEKGAAEFDGTLFLELKQIGKNITSVVPASDNPAYSTDCDNEGNMIFSYMAAEIPKREFVSGYDMSDVTVYKNGKETGLFDVAEETTLLYFMKTDCGDCKKYGEAIRKQLKESGVPFTVFELSRMPEELDGLSIDSSIAKTLGLNQVPAVVSVKNKKTINAVEHPNFSDDAAEVLEVAATLRPEEE